LEELRAQTIAQADLDAERLGPISWTNETRTLGELMGGRWPRNPRVINEAEGQRLTKSIQLFGQVKTFNVSPSGKLLDGHQRSLVWTVLPQYGPDFRVDVRVASREGAEGVILETGDGFVRARPVDAPQNDVQAGIVAALRPGQGLAVGLEQWRDPSWIVGDSRDLDDHAGGLYDFIFTCPPYYDLEVYSDDPADVSNAPTYAEFLAVYREIIAKAVAKLREDRFACVVVGEIRGPGPGYYRGFVADTIAAFEDAGMRLYNEAILVTAVGSLPVRTGKAFRATRKMGKAHQNVLVFVKGDPRAATEAVGPVAVADLGEGVE